MIGYYKTEDGYGIRYRYTQWLSCGAECDDCGREVVEEIVGYVEDGLPIPFKEGMMEKEQLQKELESLYCL